MCSVPMWPCRARGPRAGTARAPSSARPENARWPSDAPGHGRGAAAARAAAGGRRDREGLAAERLLEPGRERPAGRCRSSAAPRRPPSVKAGRGTAHGAAATSPRTRRPASRPGPAQQARGAPAAGSRSASSRCSVPMYGCRIARACSCAPTTTLRACSVNRSNITPPWTSVGRCGRPRVALVHRLLADLERRGDLVHDQPCRRAFSTWAASRVSARRRRARAACSPARTSLPLAVVTRSVASLMRQECLTAGRACQGVLTNEEPDAFSVRRAPAGRRPVPARPRPCRRARSAAGRRPSRPRAVRPVVLGQPGAQLAGTAARSTIAWASPPSSPRAGRATPSCDEVGDAGAGRARSPGGRRSAPRARRSRTTPAWRGRRRGPRRR